MTVSMEHRSTPVEADAGPPESEHVPVSVVICSYSSSRRGTLSAAITAVREQLRGGDELLIVIDHNPELLEAIRGALTGAGANVRLIPSCNQRGLSGARNAGIAAARGELLVFLDDDAVPRPGWLARLAEAFADPAVIGAGGVATPTWEEQPPDWLPDEFLWVVGCSYRGLPERPTEIRNPIGANMAFRRTAVQEAGGFTDGLGRVGRIPLGCEETEFSIRAARSTGGRIVQQPLAMVDHLVTADRATLGYFLRRCWAEGLSKAFVAALTGRDSALASERHYVTRTLPAAVAAALRDAAKGDGAGFRRLLVIVTGLAVTSAGYVRGSAAGAVSRWGLPSG